MDEIFRASLGIKAKTTGKVDMDKPRYFFERFEDCMNEKPLAYNRIFSKRFMYAIFFLI